jgi:hypothetical protein
VQISAGRFSFMRGRERGESKCQVARSAAKIEHACVRPREDRSEAPRHAPPPNHVEAHRQKMIEQVVARGYAAEHLAHLARGRRFVVSF